MLVAQNSLGPVCPVPLTVRGTPGRGRPVGGQPETLSQPGRHGHGHGDRDRDWALPLAVAAGSRAGPCSAGHWHGLNLGSLKAQARAGGGLSARHRFR